MQKQTARFHLDGLLNMHAVVLTILIAIGLSSCAESDVADPKPNLEYNKGRQRAEMEGCHCNSNLPWTPASSGKRARKGWTDGYLEACIRFRKDQGC